MRVVPVGAAALLLEVDDPAAWFAALLARRQAGELAVTEIVPGARTVLLDGLADPRATAARLPDLAPAAVASPSTSLVELAVRFDGPDCCFVADRWGADVVTVLGAASLHVAFCGFAPGFAYLVGTPPWPAVPRLASPRPRVEPGSVALADSYAGIYPTATPGGWRVVGRLAAVSGASAGPTPDRPAPDRSAPALFDPRRDPPALLTPGTRVRLVAV